jgi:hypothetical protein
MKGDETEPMRKLHSEELHNLYSPNTVMVPKSRMMNWEGHARHMGKIRKAHKIFVGKPEMWIPLGNPGHK